jgi:hypothetical protein
MNEGNEKKEVTIENAIIEQAEIVIDARDILTTLLHLKCRNGVFQLGGLPLYYAKHTFDSPAGYYIYRLMETVGAKTFSGLEGMAVRIAHTVSRVIGIAHIVNENWFNPENEMVSAEKESVNAD